MESRNMALMNLFAGQQWRRRQRTAVWTQWGKESVGRMGRVAGKHTVPYARWAASGNLLCDSGSSIQCLWQPRGVGWGGSGEGGSGGRRNMYTCGWFILMCGRNQHNSVKQLSSDKKNFFNLLKYSWFAMLIFAVQQWFSYTYALILFLIFFSIIVYHRMLMIVPGENF